MSAVAERPSERVVLNAPLLPLLLVLAVLSADPRPDFEPMRSEAEMPNPELFLVGTLEFFGATATTGRFEVDFATAGVCAAMIFASASS